MQREAAMEAGWVRMFCGLADDQHIFPLLDSNGHRIAEDGECPCGAARDSEAPSLVVHRAWDGRDVIEQAEAIVNGRKP